MHFINKEAQEFCEKWGVSTQSVAAYSHWVSGLVKGANKLLLHVLKRLCAPDLDAEEKENENLLKKWPEHLDEAVRILNFRILPALRFLPK